MRQPENRRDVTRAITWVALLGGLVLLLGAVARLAGFSDHGALPLGAAIFLATPVARNLAILVRVKERAPRLLALAGTVALLVLYAVAAWSYGQEPGGLSQVNTGSSGEELQATSSPSLTPSSSLSASFGSVPRAASSSSEKPSTSLSVSGQLR